LEKFLEQKREYQNFIDSLPNLDQAPAVTLLLSSKRTTDLTSILNQINNFNYDNIQIALGLHEIKLLAEHKKLIKKLDKKILTINEYSSEYNLGKILTSLGQSVKTPLVAKIDDDDFYHENYLIDLVKTMNYSKTPVIGKALNYIYLNSVDLTVLRVNDLSVSNPYQYDNWVCGGTIMIETELAKRASWFGDLSSGVDKFILSSASNLGAKIFRTHGYGYLYTRNSLTHTYNTNNNKYIEGYSDLTGGKYGF
jgi:hypothetical protein